MKLANSTRCIAILAMAASLGLTGCNKKGQKLTSIPGTGPGAIVDDPQTRPRIPDSNPFPGANPAGPGIVSQVDPNQGYKAAIGDWDKWFANPNEFKDQTVYFDFDKATVKPSEVGKLKEVVRRMKSFPGKALRIEGHCDERGTEEYNRTLGDRRAQSIREFLVKEGFSADMMPTITYGEDKPADPGHTDAAFIKNRRGELILLSPTQ